MNINTVRVCGQCVSRIRDWKDFVSNCWNIYHNIIGKEMYLSFEQEPM